MFSRTQGLAKWVVCAAFILGGCAMDGPAYAPPAPGVQATVDMGVVSFNPEAITIQRGQTIEWRNTSPMPHTVTADPRLAKKPGSAQLPLGARAFNSGDIPAGQVYRYTFKAPGTYRYFCIYHEEHGMVGTVIVK